MVTVDREGEGKAGKEGSASRREREGGRARARGRVPRAGGGRGVGADALRRSVRDDGVWGRSRRRSSEPYR